MEIEVPYKVKQPSDCRDPEKSNDCASNPIHGQPPTATSFAFERCFARIAHDILRDELDRNPEAKG